MELTLKQETLSCFELAADFAVTQEQSAEVIVPDSSPDIARIVSVEGEVFLRSSDAREGKAEISGVARLSLLYIPDKTPMLQTLDYTLPFVLVEDCPKECSVLRATLYAEELNARTLNPRKVQLQCRIGGSVSGYRRISLPYTTDLAEPTEECTEVLRRTERVTAITALEERDFSHEETLHLPQNRGVAATICCSRVQTQVTEAKIIGKRAIVKGDCFADFLVRYDSGRCEASTFEVPFSQIMELDAPPDAILQAALQLTAAEARLSDDGDGGSEIALSLFGKVQLTVMERREVTMLCDLYSTAYDMEVERQELSLHDLGERQQRRQIWQDTIEVGLMPERVLWLSASCGTVNAYRGASGEAELRALLHLRLLYAGEEGRILTAERSAEVLLPMEETGEGLRCRALCGEDATAVVTADGIAVRIPVDFAMERRQMKHLGCVQTVRCDHDKPKDLSSMPSLVLRRKREGETLWQIAKQHNTAAADILCANGCAEESELSQGSLLLIPKRR